MEHYATSLQHILAELERIDLLFLISVRIQPSLSESGEAQMHARIITSPIYAKTLLKTLLGAIEYYEQTFGVIPREDKNCADPERFAPT